MCAGNIFSPPKVSDPDPIPVAADKSNDLELQTADKESARKKRIALGTKRLQVPLSGGSSSSSGLGIPGV